MKSTLRQRPLMQMLSAPMVMFVLDILMVLVELNSSSRVVRCFERSKELVFSLIV